MLQNHQLNLLLCNTFVLQERFLRAARLAEFGTGESTAKDVRTLQQSGAEAIQRGLHFPDWQTQQLHD